MKNKFLIIALLAAFALRLGYVLYPHQIMENDSHEYHNIAVNLMNGHGYSIIPDVPSARRAPVYPLFLLSLYRVFGVTPLPVELAQVLASLLICLLVYGAGRELFSERAARAGLLLAAFYPPLIAYPGLMLTETLFTLWIAATIWSFLRAVRLQSPGSYVLPGACMGLAVLTRPDSLLIPFLLLFVLLIRYRDKTKAVTHFGILLACMLVLALPWSVRNWRQFHSVFPGQSGALGPLVRGSAEYALKGTTEYNVEAWSNLKQYYDSIGVSSAPEKVEGRLLKEGVGIIASNPAKFAALLARRFPRFWITSHSALFGIREPNGRYLASRQYFPVLAKGLLTAMHVSLLLLFIAGLWLERKRFPEVLLPFLLAGYATLYIFLDVPSRHHVPYMPHIIVLAGAALARVLGGRGETSV